MSRPTGSPPPSWYKYPSQGSAVGPPPMPNKPLDERSHRSPDRRTSPGYDREAEWRRFQEWEKRNKKSPPRTTPNSPPRSQHRPPSPRGRSPPKAPPPDWGRRSPPYSYRPPEWGRRSRSPPPWGRRSPLRFGPPRGRSPPRHHSPPRWGPPPPGWDRYGAPPAGRRSPPHWGPPPHWDARRERYPPPQNQYNRWAPLPAGKQQQVKPNGPSPTVPPVPMSKPVTENIKSDDGSAEEEILENFDLPDYDAESPIGQKYVIAVSGFFCKICHKFYNSESSAKITHCKSKAHYEKFTKWVNDKKLEAVEQKRPVTIVAPPPVPTVPNPSPVPTVVTENATQDVSDEPPAKVCKVEVKDVEEPHQENMSVPEEFSTGLVVKEEIQAESDNEESNTKYDPSEPTTEENTNTNKDDPADASSDQLSDVDKTPAGDGDYVAATLYNFRKMRVHQLKHNLKNRDLPVHGLKPLLLKRLEKALLAEAKAAATEHEENDQENNEESVVPGDQTNINTETGTEVGDEAKVKAEESGDASKELTLTMHESDIEVANKKSQWITERELEREILQLSGITKVVSMEKEENKMGRKTVVEWTIKILYQGEFPEDGLNFWMDSHQHLPYRALLAE